MSQSIQPNSYTLTALMKTCVKKEDWSRARELLIIGASLLLQSISFNAHARACICICACVRYVCGMCMCISVTF